MSASRTPRHAETFEPASGLVSKCDCALLQTVSPGFRAHLQTRSKRSINFAKGTDTRCNCVRRITYPTNLIAKQHS